MSRYIDAEALKEKYTMVIKRYSGGIMERPAVLLETIDDAPSIDLDDYVPKDFHDKTCEAMAKRHQAEITDILERADGYWTKTDVATYRCSECGKIQIADDVNELNFCCCCGSRNKVRRLKGADDE